MNTTNSPMKSASRLPKETAVLRPSSVIPAQPRTTASTITNTISPAISRMTAGMTGVSAPQEPELLDLESVTFCLLRARPYHPGCDFYAMIPKTASPSYRGDCLHCDSEGT